MRTNCLLCNRMVQTRGLCRTHYRRALRDVTAGEYSWEDAEDRGLALPTQDNREKLGEWFRRLTA